MRVANKWRQIFRQQKFGGVYKQVYIVFMIFFVHIYISSNNCNGIWACQRPNSKRGPGGESLECKRKSLYNRRYSNKYIRGDAHVCRSINNNIMFRIFHISSSVSVIHRESRAFWQINNVFVSIYRLREREIEREIDNEVTMIQRGA
jgi:hypothetical protein